MFIIDKSLVPDTIIESIVDTLKNGCSEINDEDDYYDALHFAIDDFVSCSNGEVKELVDELGVLTAIRLYKENYGEFILDDDDDKVYMTLGFNIIKEWFDNYYSYDELRTNE